MAAGEEVKCGEKDDIWLVLYKEGRPKGGDETTDERGREEGGGAIWGK